VLFLAAGAGKGKPLHKVLDGEPDVEEVPAAGVRPLRGTVSWFLDVAAHDALRREREQS